MALDFKKLKDQLLFVPLGGCNEIGMNLNLYHYQGKWLIADMGIGFADEYYPGVDITLPNIDFLQEIKKDILAMVFTHAHEDHIGAVPYLYDQVKAPVYASPFCAAMLREKMAGMSLPKLAISEIVGGRQYEVGAFVFEAVNITHSIPEMYGLTIKTAEGTVVHTGDWKFDDQPVLGQPSDYRTLETAGDDGVLAMVCDSTNVFVKGESGSETMVRDELARVIATCKGRVAVTTFASNVGRLESIIHAAHAAGRKVAFAGRALKRVTAAATASGYMQDLPEIYDDRTAMALPRDKVLFICTGCQGEPLAATSKIANGEHPAIKFAPGDTFIFSSRVIPGNDRNIAFLQNRMTMRGIEIINASNDDRIHVSGHPARGELEKMYKLVRPKIAVPVHGEQRHIAEHAKFARENGATFAVRAENGSVVNLSKNGEIIGKVKSGYMVMDGISILPSDSQVMKTRRRLKLGGAVFITMAMDSKGNLLSEPSISAPGSLDDGVDGELFALLAEELSAEFERARNHKKGGDAGIREAIRSCARRVIKQELDKKPVVEVHLVKV